MRRFLFVTLLVSALGFCALAAAQDTNPEAAQRNEALERIEMVRLYRLVELLSLNSEQAARMFPIFQRYDREFREIVERKEQAYALLQQEVKAPNPDSKKLSNLADEIVDQEREAMQVREEQYKELKKQLTAEQCAKYLLFEKKFQKEINRILEDVRTKKPTAPKAK